ncbi:MAG: hypothetical protein Q8J68_08940 [Methanolobus sp.]|uniref:hypothetical protein n=1 Tax=Methanolobus sp. TaxID=1874737 RepID=UPI002731F8CA|nr:hypothetical protein [Methanolobus sp.]MDP2217398.1 hypothetical protein [Methanolobus sp.]
MQYIINADPKEQAELIRKGRILATGFNIPDDEVAKLMQEDKLLAADVVDGREIRWNPAKDRDPRIKENESSKGFRFCPYFHENGRFLQSVVKRGIIKAIETAHSQIVGKYDPEAFGFDDLRLQEISGYLRSYTSQNFSHEAPRKITFMSQILDIVLFLMKEDIYYRARFLDMCKHMPRDYELTEEERRNIQQWH